MQTIMFGATGIRVSRLCLGTMMFGAGGNPDEADCARIIHRAIDAGVNFIDTADVYSDGQSERIVGQAIKGKRNDLVLATKFALPMSPEGEYRGGSRRWIMKAIDDSLQRLGVDHIDLYQMHRFDPKTEVEETLFTLTELVRAGKIRHFGSSMFPPDRIVECHWTSEKRGFLKFRSEQAKYNVFGRDVERFVLPACQRYGMGMLAYAPLEGGFLSGKYRSTGDLATDNRVARTAKRIRGSFDPKDEAQQHKLRLVGELTQVAEEAGLTLAQMSVAFAITHPAVSAAIIGPRTMEHLETIIAAGDVKLSDEVLDRIDALSPPGTSISPVNDTPSGLDKKTRRGRN